MRSQNRFLKPVVLLAMAPLCSAGTFTVLGSQTSAWPAILSSVGHIAGPPAFADITVAPPATPASIDWKGRVGNGAALILEGSHPRRQLWFSPAIGNRFRRTCGRCSQSVAADYLEPGR